MTINNIEVVFYTLAFIIPGFIFSATYNKFVPRKQSQQPLLQYLLFTCVNYSFNSIPIIHLIFNPTIKNSLIISWT